MKFQSLLLKSATIIKENKNKQKTPDSVWSMDGRKVDGVYCTM